MNHIRRIAVTLTGLAAVSAFSAPAPLALAARLPPPGADAPQAGRGPLQQCPSVAAAQPQVGKAWEHRRKVGGVGPAVGGVGSAVGGVGSAVGGVGSAVGGVGSAVGGWCSLNQADRYAIRTTPHNLRAGR